MSKADDQQFCLRWNNFQANITSQFENLRDEEDFTDVTIACEGQQLQAHKIILSACSPLFKELFKSNPCKHPIIFMRDVEAQHIVALMEFMYAGEVNVAQTQLSSFLKTAESLKIRGLTDSSLLNAQDDSSSLSTKSSSSSPSKVQLCCSSSTDNNKSQSTKPKSSCIGAVTSSQDFPSSPDSLPSSNRQRRSEKSDPLTINAADELSKSEAPDIDPFTLQNTSIVNVEPKLEIPDYLSDEEAAKDDGEGFSNFDCGTDDDISEFTGGMEIITQPPGVNLREFSSDNLSTLGKFRRRQMMDEYFSYTNGTTQNGMSNKINNSYTQKDGKKSSKMVKLGDGIEIYEDQLRSVKWSDYRKLTRGLATILFSPTELATCSVTGQRWSRAGNGERPVKPALDRSKVQAIISYVAMRFPTVEISRIKQVLAYKCKENSTAFKMKAVRYYGNKHLKGSNNN